MISLKLTIISRVRENRVRSWFNLPRFIITSARNQWSGSCQSSSSEHSYRPAHGNPAAANFSALLSFCLQLRSTSKQAKRTIWTFEKCLVLNIFLAKNLNMFNFNISASLELSQLSRNKSDHTNPRDPPRLRKKPPLFQRFRCLLVGPHGPFFVLGNPPSAETHQPTVQAEDLQLLRDAGVACSCCDWVGDFTEWSGKTIKNEDRTP